MVAAAPDPRSAAAPVAPALNLVDAAQAMGIAVKPLFPDAAVHASAAVAAPPSHAAQSGIGSHRRGATALFRHASADRRRSAAGRKQIESAARSRQGLHQAGCRKSPGTLTLRDRRLPRRRSRTSPYNRAISMQRPEASEPEPPPGRILAARARASGSSTSKADGHSNTSIFAATAAV